MTVAAVATRDGEGVGGAKRYMEEVEERGWADVGKQVCSGCVTDSALKAAIRSHGGAAACDYCGRKPAPPEAAAPVELILGLIVDGFRYEYEDPVQQVLYSSRDGGYQMPSDDTWDLLGVHEVTENGDLVDDLVLAIQQEDWVQRDPYAASPTDALRWGWDAFKDFVKHRRRYTFLAGDPSATHGAGEITMEEVPAAVAAAVETAKQIRVLPGGTRWWRLRPHPPGEVHRSADALGSPPDGAARDNRMTAKGIGAFYGASTAEGARAEVAGYCDPTNEGTIGQFELLRDISIVDLRSVEPVPSLFDELERHRRAEVTFMRDFVKDVAKVANPADEQNLDYIPTQVIAEHFRYELSGTAGAVAGILWRSSKDPSVDVCVIFASNDQMAELGAPSTKAILALDPATVAVIDPPL